jgi:hypothetical protein
MISKQIVFSILAGIILSGILTNVFSVGAWNFVQKVEAQSKSKFQAQGQAAIKKAYEALAASGMTGTPGGLQSTGDGFAQFYRNSNGTAAFVIFWKPSTGAHALVGPIMSTYKSEGWHLGDLGYPTSNEKDLTGVTDGRYNQFEHGVIAMVKGKGAQAFPTIQAAVDKLKAAAPQYVAAAAIKKAYEALAASGMTGTPGGLQSTGDGFAQFYRDSNGKVALAIFWKPDIGAYAVAGPIMSTYKSEGWHLGDLGYPTSNEKDLTGVTDGRYNQFEHGVIAMLKGSNAQAFPTIQAAVDKLKQAPTTGPVTQQPTTQPPTTGPVTQQPTTPPPEPAKAPPLEKYRVKVTFDTITVHNDHEAFGEGDGEYKLGAYVDGLPITDLTALSQWKTPGAGALNDVASGETLKFQPGNSYVTELDSMTALPILAVGKEYDGCNSGIIGLLPTSISGPLEENRKNMSRAAGAAVGGAYGGPAGAMVGEKLGPVLDKISNALEKKITGYVLCKINADDDIGSIEAHYDPPTYGAGQKCEKSDAGDYTLCYTISAQKIG